MLRGLREHLAEAKKGQQPGMGGLNTPMQNLVRYVEDMVGGVDRDPAAQARETKARHDRERAQGQTFAYLSDPEVARKLDEAIARGQ